jgi:predicted small lipoprotein YifL
MRAMTKHAVALLAIGALAVNLAACGKKEPVQVKSDAQVKAERDAATKATRENPVYGDQLKQMDKAKELGKDMNKMAEDAVKKAEDGVK